MAKIKLKFNILLILIIISVIKFTSALESMEEVETNLTRPINLLIVNEKTNRRVDRMINKSIDSALETISSRTNIIVNVTIITLNGSNAEKSLEIFGNHWDWAISAANDSAPDLILDVTRSSYLSEFMLMLTSSLAVPTFAARFGELADLSASRNLFSDQSNYLIQIRPPEDYASNAVRYLCSNMNISNAAIIYDDYYVMDHKYKSLLLNVPTRHVIVKAQLGPTNIRNHLQKLRSLDITNYFIVSDESIICSYLEVAENLNFTGRKYGWYAISLDPDFLPACKIRNITIVLFRPEPPKYQPNLDKLKNQKMITKPYISSAFYYDFIRAGIYAIAYAISADEWPSQPEYMTIDEAYIAEYPLKRNISLSNNLVDVTSPKIFESSYAEFDLNVYKRSGKLSIHVEFNMGVYKINITNNRITVKKLGIWSPKNNSLIDLVGNAAEILANHTAIISFRVVTVEVAPFVQYNNKTGEWTGYCIDLLNEIKKKLGFEYEIYEVPDKQFGTMNQTDLTWNGMIGELINKRADIAIGTLSVMAERENVVDFTVPYYDLVGLSILMLKPRPPTSLFKFLTVLENDVWLCILAVYFISSLMMWIFDRYSPYSYQNNKEKYITDIEKREFNLRECLWFCMTSLTPQGGGDSPKNLSGRVVAAVWWMFGFIIIASYTANLAAFLTVSRLEAPVESLDDLSKQYKIEYAPIYPSEAFTYFERMTNIEKRFYEIWKNMVLDDNKSDEERAKLAVWDYPMSNKYTKMFQRMNETGFPRSKEEAIARVRRQIKGRAEREFAFIGDATEIKYLSMTNCDLQMVGDEFSRKPYAIAVQQGSPLRDLLNNVILKLLNQRVLETLKNDWWDKNRKSCNEGSDQSDGISINNIGGVFIVIFVGIILACMTLAFEYWYYRQKPEDGEKKVNVDSNKVQPKGTKPIHFNLKFRLNVQKENGLRARF